MEVSPKMEAREAVEDEGHSGSPVQSFITAGSAPRGSNEMVGSDCTSAAAPKMAASHHVAPTTVVMADGPSAGIMAAVFGTSGPSVSTRQHVLWPSRRRRRRDLCHEVKQNRAERVNLLSNTPPAVVRTWR
ncbi:unnamed protein product [Lampetra planeri]